MRCDPAAAWLAMLGSRTRFTNSTRPVHILRLRSGRRSPPPSPGAFGLPTGCGAGSTPAKRGACPGPSRRRPFSVPSRRTARKRGAAPRWRAGPVRRVAVEELRALERILAQEPVGAAVDELDGVVALELAERPRVAVDADVVQRRRLAPHSRLASSGRIDRSAIYGFFMRLPIPGEQLRVGIRASCCHSVAIPI